MLDLLADWKRWNLAERVAAAILAVLFVVGVPAVLLVGSVISARAG